jgi:benzoyl-CoA 2,3-dioxygenase component B
VDDCQRGVDRWNKRLTEAGIAARLRLPSKRFYRHIGIYADMQFDIDGKRLSREEWEQRKGEWLPTDEDRAYVATLQKPVYEVGKIANWIGKPARGIKGLPFEYEYVRLD